MNVLVIGGVAAGTKVAAKIKRDDYTQNVKILTKGEHISYAGCGLPYYVGDVIEEKEDLIQNTPESFKNLTGAEVETQTEVVKVIPEEKKVIAKDLVSGEESEHEYDKLVIATGADPIKPPLEGIDGEGIFFMRTPEDAYGLRDYIEENDCKRAVVVGGGFIGLEVAENLKKQDIFVSVIDMADQVLPGFDKSFADYIENHLAEDMIMTFTETALEGFELDEDGRVATVKTSRNDMKADVVCLSIGVRPNTAFLEGSGIEMDQKGTILVNDKMETNIEDIYAVGDCVLVTNAITGKPQYSPMGSTANITGRIAAQNILGGDEKYRGALGTAIVSLPGLNAGKTGLTEDQAKAEGFDVISATATVDDYAHYMPGNSVFTIKVVADKTSRKLLGVTAIGPGAVDKIVDIMVAAIYAGATIDDLKDADFAYAPPFSTAIHPLAHTLNVLDNKIAGDMKSITPNEYQEGAGEGYRMLDTALEHRIMEAEYIPVQTVHEEEDVEAFDKDEKILLVCDKGKRAYMLQQRMEDMGYEDTLVLEGGLLFNEVDD